MLRTIAATLALACTALIAAAQTGTDFGPAVGPTLQPADSIGQIRRLDAESLYRTNAGFCDIPDVLAEGLRGTMRFRPLRPANADDPTLRTFRVDDVNLMLSIGAADLDDTHITGSGTLTVRETVIPERLVRLTLNLSFGDADPVRFDSGDIWVPAVTPTLDIEVFEDQGQFPCGQRILRLVTTIVPRTALIPYALGDTAFLTYQLSPFGPVFIAPMGGTYSIVELPLDPAVPAGTSYDEYAIVRTDWVAGLPTTQPSDAPARVRAVGVLQRILGTFTGVPVERLQMKATLRGANFLPTELRFDSGVVGSNAGIGTIPPAFSIFVADTDPAFPDVGMNIVGGPLPLAGR